MTVRSISVSGALHASLLLAMLWPGVSRRPAEHPADGKGHVVPLAPPEGEEASRRPGPKSPGPGRERPPGGPPSMNHVEVLVDDEHSAELPAVLAQWEGKLTACRAAAPGTVRFWLYDPDHWKETRGWRSIPCADFPAPFRAEVNARIAEEAERRRVAKVRRAIVGFSRGAPGGVVILRVE